MRRVVRYLSLPVFFVAAFLLAGSAEAATIQSVQKGEIVAPATVSINAVNPERTFVICYNRINHSEPHRFLCELENAATLRISTAANLQGTGVPSENIVSWQVVEFESGARVQRGRLSHNPRFPGTTNVPISAVNRSRSFVLINEGGHNRLGQESWLRDNEWLVTAALTGDANLRIQSGPIDLPPGLSGAVTGKEIPVVWQVVELDDIVVQRGVLGEPAAIRTIFEPVVFFDQKEVTVPITPVDSSSGFPLITRRPVSKTGMEAYYQVAANLDGASLRMRRLGDLASVAVSWEVVQLGGGARAQSGLSTAVPGQSEITITLNQPADLTRSFVFLNANGGERTNSPGFPTLGGQLFWSAITLDDTSWTPTLTNSNTLILRRSGNLTAPSTVSWSVINFSSQAAPPRAVACTQAELQALSQRIADDSRCELNQSVSDSLSTTTIPVIIDNPNDEPATDVTVNLAIPDGITPVDLASNLSWDPVSRVLTVSLGDFNAGEEKTFDLTVQQAPGTCFMYGAIRGSFTGGPFCERRGPVVSNVAIVFTPIARIQQVINTVTNTVTEATTRLVENIRENTRLSNAIQYVGLPTVITLGAVGGATTVAAAASASAPLAWNLLELLRFLLLGFLRFKKHRPWGTVFDAFTKKPVAGATVQIIDTEFQRVKETQITDQDGRFGFLATPGDYYLRISRTGYQKNETPVFHIKDPSEKISMDANLSPLSAENLKKVQFRKVLSEIKQLLEILNPYILIFGTALSVLMFILFPTLLNYLVLMLYLVLGGFKIWLALNAVKSFGQVLDKSVRDPLPLSVVRVYDEKRNWLMGTRVTGPDGKFKFLLMPGTYSVSAEKENYQPFHSGILDLKKPGVVTRDIELRKS